MELAGNIYRLRAERGMSQEELAAALGVSRQSVSKWETGAATPELDKVAALAALFGVTMDELVLGEARPAQETPAEGESEGAVNCFPPRRRYIAAVALLCTGAALAAVLFLLGAGLIWPVIFTSPLWLCGLVCLRARRHVGFWCCVAAYLPVLWYIKWGTRVSYGDLFFWAPYNNPMRGIIYIVLVVCNVGLIVYGIRSFCDTELRSRRPWLRVALCAALYVAAYFLPIYMLMDGLPGRALAVAFDVARYALLAGTLIYGSVALRMRKKRADGTSDG